MILYYGVENVSLQYVVKQLFIYHYQLLMTTILQLDSSVQLLWTSMALNGVKWPMRLDCSGEKKKKKTAGLQYNVEAM